MKSTPPGSDLLALSISELGDGFRKRRFSPVELVRATFDAIESDQLGINAFTHLDLAAALAAARAAEQRLHDNAPLGPLDGIPVSIKDLLNVSGWPTRRGSMACMGEPDATEDAPAVAALRKGGAVIFGKTTTTEFGWTIASSSPHGGLTRNPLNPTCSPGGSSSGAAAHVAAGWGPLALGSDAGGSVRIPAAYCGIVGFKPTFGAIPLAPPSAFAEFAHLGPLTRNVRDSALAMEVLAHAHARDPSSLYPRVPFSQTGKLRVGWSTSLAGKAALEPEITAAFSELVKTMSAEGVQIEEVAAGDETLAADMWQVWCSRIYESFEAWTPERRTLLGPQLREAFEIGAAQSSQGLARSRAKLRAFGFQMVSVFDKVDFLLTPCTPATAPPVDRLTDDDSNNSNWFDIGGFTFPFNLTQQPALSMPLGQSGARMPFGLQVVGRKYHDGLVLAFAEKLEQMLGQNG